MPLYEYECLQCKDVFEVIQKFSDAPVSTCNKCGGELRKLISNTAFVLKGEGWYVTDYPSKDRKAALDKEKPATPSKDTSSGTGDSSKSETSTKSDAASTKTETKTETASKGSSDSSESSKTVSK
ncbi:FmdB family zinc ribbon protein [Candidatus Magnetomonas plexicatena]|uniref:FmdB family zinc ribbon protein n=1 Tax=Candidatus Magnetomonas plexicatena TaxID=2552947 RepID=UPI0011012571|nr:zinc ribbon domain-containing protein [Nitrospirales bacterium LBB_01]